jgi:RNA polymerase sigma-70 factor (sigma-E family)
MRLLKRVRDVKQEEFTQFYRSDQAACLRTVLVSVGDRQLAEDLVAEAFTRAWTSWHKVSRHPAPRAWIVRTALNARVSWWRRQRREVAWEDNDQVEDPGTGRSELDPALLIALRQLPRRQREVIACRVFLDLDTGGTADVLGIAPGTVTAHLSRAVASLRAHLIDQTDLEVRP